MRRSPGAINCSARTNSASFDVLARCRGGFRSRPPPRSLVVVRRPRPASDEALRAAASLIDKSLLLRAETSVASRPLYQMLETVRAYAVLELAAEGERDDALAGLARYCTAEASLAAKELVGPAQAEWLDRVRDDLESYRAALTWLIERGRPAESVDIAWGLMHFWVIRGHAAEGLHWYEQILTLPSVPPVAESEALVGAAMMWYTQGELGRARVALTRALALAHDAGDTEIVAQAEHLLGHVEHALGDMNAARDLFIRSVEGFRALAIPWGIGNSLNGMAKVALASGDVAEAERLLDEAASVLRHARGTWHWCRIVAPCWRCGSGTLMRRSCWRRSASHSSGSSMTGSRSCTRWSLWPPRQPSRATTCWRRGSWALAPP